MVIYHLDDKNGIETANLLTKKGFPHLLLLSGGIEEFGVAHSDAIEGSDIPVFRHNEIRFLNRREDYGGSAGPVSGGPQECQ
jgi:hypothetical protein